MKKILIIGAGGQIGSELTTYLRGIYGSRNVVATDVRECKALGADGPFEVLDALNATSVASVVARHEIDTIFNLVALLSAVGERNPHAIRIDKQQKELYNNVVIDNDVII